MTQSSEGKPPRDDEEIPTVVRDKRRIDPETGTLRSSASTTTEVTDPVTTQSEPRQEPSKADAADNSSEGDSAAELAAERLADLQRLQAEYVNYRKRVERDREMMRTMAVAAVMESLLPVLDDVHLAREHGDLADGPFAAIADKLESTLSKHGLERYGSAGEEFDPAVHEALSSTPSADVSITTVSMVMQPGYTLGEKVLRPARVGVNSPE